MLAALKKLLMGILVRSAKYRQGQSTLVLHVNCNELKNFVNVLHEATFKRTCKQTVSVNISIAPKKLVGPFRDEETYLVGQY